MLFCNSGIGVAELSGYDPHRHPLHGQSACICMPKNMECSSRFDVRAPLAPSSGRCWCEGPQVFPSSRRKIGSTPARPAVNSASSWRPSSATTCLGFPDFDSLTVMVPAFSLKSLGRRHGGSPSPMRRGPNCGKRPRMRSRPFGFRVRTEIVQPERRPRATASLCAKPRQLQYGHHGRCG
jgi:hypothetical protein